MGQPSEVNITHQTADNEGSHYNALAPGLRDSDESHKMLNYDHKDHPPLYNQELPGAVWTHRIKPGEHPWTEVGSYSYTQACDDCETWSLASQDSVFLSRFEWGLYPLV